MRSTTLCLLIVSPIVSIGCGSSVDCGDGTFRDGDNCIAFDPNDKTPPVLTLDPPGRRSRDPLPAFATLSSDEAAQIFFTTDGSDPTLAPGEPSPVTLVDLADGATISYFAIDRAGNQSEVETATYISDREPPAPVTNLTITPGATDAMLTWTNPSDPDFTGVVVARVLDLVDGAPEDGTLYNAPSQLTASLQLIQAGLGTQVDDTARPPGRVRYVVWAFDDLGNYSAPASVRGEIPLDDLEIEFTFDPAAGGTLTQTKTSTALDASATTFTFDGANSKLTLSLSATNLSSTFFQNPKAEVVSVTGGSFTGSAGTADGHPFARLGTGTFAPAATVTKDLVFNSVTATATIRLKLGSHVSLISTRNQTQTLMFFDLGASQESTAFTTLTVGPSGRGKIRPALFVGEHFVDVPTQHGSIERWDTVTQSRIAGITVNPAAGQDRADVSAIVSDGVNEYAIVRNGRTRDQARLSVLRFDETLHETGRIDLTIADDRGFTHAAMSPDNSILAIPARKSIALIDTRTFTVRDADPSSDETEITTDINDRLRALAFFDGNNGLLGVSRSGGQAVAVHLTPTGYTTTMLSAGTSVRGNAVALAPDGKVFVAFDTAPLRLYDPTTDAMTSSTCNVGSTALMFFKGQLRSLKTSRSQVDLCDTSSGGITTTNLPAGAFGHWISTTSN